MNAAKQKAVFNADKDDLAQVEALVAEGRYRSVSEFVREAIAKRLRQLEALRLREQVARYVAKARANEDAELIEHQAFDGRRGRAKR